MRRDPASLHIHSHQALQIDSFTYCTKYGRMLLMSKFICPQQSICSDITSGDVRKKYAQYHLLWKQGELLHLEIFLYVMCVYVMCVYVCVCDVCVMCVYVMCV